MKGTGNSLNYKYRMHDPRLGRFFAVDPLTAKYPYYTPYSFSGNKVIDHIELEGMEDLKVVINSQPTIDKPGKAKIVITMEYEVPTQGAGKMQNFNKRKVKKRFDWGDGTFYMYNLPTPTEEAVFLSDRYERWARRAQRGNENAKNRLTSAGIKYYIVDVDYNVTVKDGLSLQSIYNWFNLKRHERGIVMNVLSTNELDEARSTESLNYRLLSENYRAKFKFLANSNIGGRGTCEEGVMDFNLSIINPNTDMDEPIDVLVTHEIGHNMAKKHRHTEDQSGDYEYNQPGLQNNTNPYPTEQNTKTIINDETNRQTIHN